MFVKMTMMETKIMMAMIMMIMKSMEGRESRVGDLLHEQGQRIFALFLEGRAHVVELRERAHDRCLHRLLVHRPHPFSVLFLAGKPHALLASARARVHVSRDVVEVAEKLKELLVQEDRFVRFGSCNRQRSAHNQS